MTPVGAERAAGEREVGRARPVERAEAHHALRAEALGAPARAGDQAVELRPVPLAVGDERIYPHRVDYEPLITLLTPEGVEIS